MDTKKDIGRLFKERFKDFEQAPNGGTWDKIASGLDEERDRPIAIFWLRWGGVLLIALILGGLLWTSFDSKSIGDPEEVLTNPVIVQQNDALETFEKSNTNPTQLHTPDATKNNQQSPLSDKTPTSEIKNTPDSKTDIYNKQEESIQNQVVSSPSTEDENKNGITNSDNIQNNTATPQRNGNRPIAKTSAINNSDETVYNSNNRLTGLFSIDQEDQDYYSQQRATEEQLRSLYKAKVQQELDEAILEQRTAATEAYTNWQEEQEKTNTTNNSESSTLNEITEISDTVDVSSTEATAPPEEKENKAPRLPKTEEERKLDREAAINYKWGVSPYINSLRYGSLSRGSSIDNRLERNPQEGISTIGYGLKFEFSVSEKSSIRAGVGISPLSYQTDNFQVSIVNNAVNIFQLAGISPETASQGAVATSPEALAFFTENTVVSIVQDISYIEFPVDYQYRFLNKRIGLSINPGLSLFLLTENTISAIANDGRSLDVGRETSLRDLSFGLNVGLGTYYNLSPAWRFNVEPIFSYQLNPYTTDIGNFRPFYLGLQFGTTYKF